MRARQLIEKDFKPYNQLSLEVLLDIRSLLQKQKVTRKSDIIGKKPIGRPKKTK